VPTKGWWGGVLLWFVGGVVLVFVGWCCFVGVGVGKWNNFQGTAAEKEEIADFLLDSRENSGVLVSS